MRYLLKDMQNKGKGNTCINFNDYIKEYILTVLKTDLKFQKTVMYCWLYNIYVTIIAERNRDEVGCIRKKYLDFTSIIHINPK